MKIYTKTGDGGTTGLLYGGRVPKDSVQVELNGAVDEAQAHVGVVRAHASGELAEICRELELDLWILMAEVATQTGKRDHLIPGKTLVTESMVAHLEELIDQFSARFAPPKEFVVPGEEVAAAFLDVSRTVVRRAERCSLGFVREAPDSFVQVYLNRLSDLLWTLARWSEGASLTAREAKHA
ncbi:cob(I)yrinic acid a,c-diamide adenosyltransferase [Ferrimicrobium acidiphilum]|uniref:cob(I)yrinic acid a,c-diamide adenosyltransferase n=1 Tax=Ferrimicrobium acidiphilum TaxID=121039 RepID=UPI0023F21A58|nr:cob(I)yrinic acid a,c-diamide adenosyltransferase [Ferrimicrobium acidiphilum]